MPLLKLCSVVSGVLLKNGNALIVLYQHKEQKYCELFVAFLYYLVVQVI